MTCVECKKEIPRDQQNAAEDVPDGYMHSDCYWTGLGDLIEKHPIGAVHAARIRRGEKTDG